MFDLSPEKLLVILVIAMIVLGPERLPKAARTLGKVLHQARSATAGMQQEMHSALAEPRRVLDETMGEMGLPRSVPKMPNVRDALNAAIAPPIAAVGATATDPTTATPATDPGPPVAATSGAGVAGAAPRPPDDPNLN